MVIEPKMRGFISTTAHPHGCNEHVRQQIEYVKSQGKINSDIKNVLVIGSSTGYGLATKIAAAYGLGAKTIGVHFERGPRGKRTGSAGFYNDEAFRAYAEADGLETVSINGDAFSQEIKDEVLEEIKNLGEKIDLVVYSLAAPRRTTADGTTYSSVIKPVGETYTGKSLNMNTNQVEIASIEPATEEEIAETVKVMGGEDWEDWIAFLDENEALSDGALTLAYSYIGPEITQAIYTTGSIGHAKQDLYDTAERMRETYQDKYNAVVAVNKAVVTQSSAAIPSIGLYISALFKVMKEQGSHEDCIHQMHRLFAEKINSDRSLVVDENTYIRLDDWEMAPEVQEPVNAAFDLIDSDNVEEHADLDGFWDDFYNLFGFRIDNVDYDRDVDIENELGGYVGPLAD